MKYSLDLDEPLEDEVRRIASGRLTDAAGLLREQPDGLDEAIHLGRRHIKQCRALYRLVRNGAEDFQKAENERLGEIGRRLSRMRDATALIDATQYLKHEIPSKSNGMLMDRLAKRLDRRRETKTRNSNKAQEALASAADDLLVAADAVSDLSLPHGRRKSANCVAGGWEKIGKKAQAAIKASADGHDEAFHDLRKRTQDRWTHAALLRDVWPSAMTAIHRRAKMLSDMLGHAQDLTLLLHTVSDSSELVADAVESEAISDVVLAQKSKLQDECREFAQTLFANAKPRDGKQIALLLQMR